MPQFLFKNLYAPDIPKGYQLVFNDESEKDLKGDSGYLLDAIK